MYVIPKPQELKYQEGQYILAHQGCIILAPECAGKSFSHAKLLQKELEKLLGYSLVITRGDREAGGIYFESTDSLKPEEYLLRINENGISLQGGSEKAILYGIQTLRQIIAQEGACLPYLTIRDYPDMENRGYYLDATRGRIPTLGYLKSFADKLSF